MIRYTALCGLVCLATQLIAAEGLSGTWKLDPAKGTGAAWAQYDKEGEFLVWSNVAGTMAKFKVDGKEYPTVNGKGTTSWKQIDKNTIQSTNKLDGKLISTSTMTFSPDGKSRTVIQKGVDSMGKPYESIQKSTRVASASDASNLLLGKWTIDRNGATGTFPALVIDAKSDRITVSGANSFEAAFDGKDYPLKRSANAEMVSARRIDERTVETTMKAKGQLIGTNTFQVSADGKMLSVSTTRNNATTTSVFTRQ